MQVIQGLAQGSAPQGVAEGAGGGPITNRSQPHETFSNVLLAKGQSQITPAPQGSTLRSLEAYLQSWENSQRRTNKAMELLPAQSRELLQLQVEVQRLGLETHVLTALGECVSSTMKRVQQSGGS